MYIINHLGIYIIYKRFFPTKNMCNLGLFKHIENTFIFNSDSFKKKIIIL